MTFKMFALHLVSIPPLVPMQPGTMGFKVCISLQPQQSFVKHSALITYLIFTHLAVTLGEVWPPFCHVPLTASNLKNAPSPETKNFFREIKKPINLYIIFYEVPLTFTNCNQTKVIKTIIYFKCVLKYVIH
jgi:hypothetical protein